MPFRVTLPTDQLAASSWCDAFFFGIYRDLLIWAELTFDLGRVCFSSVPNVLNLSRELVPSLSIVACICPKCATDCPLFWIWSMH